MMMQLHRKEPKRKEIGREIKPRVSLLWQVLLSIHRVRDESRHFFSSLRIKFLGSRVSRMLGLQYASCCEPCKVCDLPTLEAGWWAGHGKSTVTAFEVWSRGWPVAGAVAITGVRLRCRSSASVCTVGYLNLSSTKILNYCVKVKWKHVNINITPFIFSK